MIVAEKEMEVVPSPAVMESVLSLKVRLKTEGAPGLVPNSNVWKRVLISSWRHSYSLFVVTREPSTLTNGFGRYVIVGSRILPGREGQAVVDVVARFRVN